MGKINIKLEANMEVGFGLINTVSPVNLSFSIHNKSSNEIFISNRFCISLKKRFLFINWWHNDVMMSNTNISVRPNLTIYQPINGQRIQDLYGGNVPFTVKVFGNNGKVFESDMSRINTILANANAMLGL